MDIKNLIKNITPSVTIMAIGLVGAYFVYNTYFSDRVASNAVVRYEPAAGQEEVVMDEAADMASEESAVVYDGTDATQAETVVEGEEEAEMVAPEAVVVEEGGMEEAVDSAVQAAEEALDNAGQAAEEMTEETGEKAH